MRHTTYGILVIICLLLVGGSATAQQQAVAERHVVASGHEDATRIGLDVLRDGGNAIDAAVAVSMALGVAEPYGSGLGGKLVLLHYDAATETVHCIEALCAAPAEIDIDEYAALDRRTRGFGYRSVCVPGLPAGIYMAHQRWGTKPWAELIEPAAQLAERGVAVTDKAQIMFVPKAGYLNDDPEAKRLYLVDGQVPPVGAVLKHPELAASLRQIASDGPDAFYRGPIARSIVAAAQAAGSPLTLDDMASYEARLVEPLAIDYEGRRIYSCPPPLTGGITVLLTLEALEDRDWSRFGSRDAETIDAVGRVLLGVYPRVTDVIGDRPAAYADARALLTEANVIEIREQAEKLDPANPYESAVTAPAGQPDRVAGAPDHSSTTHFVVVDQHGNWVSATQSLSYHFGASVVAPGTGILLNNSMKNFGLSNRASVNVLEPAKRPRSTIAPILMLHDGEPVLALGIPGGQRIPTTTIQLLLDVLEFDRPLPAAIDLPRYHLRRPIGSREPQNMIDLEQGYNDALPDRLEALGWAVKLKPRSGQYFGGGNAARAQADGTILGVADLRRTNHAEGD